MQNKVFDFQKSLKKGKKAENEFYELFKDKVEQLDGYIADFKIIKSGKTIELKTDFYDPTKTANFFIERYSYGDKAGGPYQSLEKNIDYYIYWFPQTMDFYCFDVKKLVKRLEMDYEDAFLIQIRNTNHITSGFTVKRSDLNDINLKIEEVLK